ncbi:hypothetical protein E1176_16420 [Fulvivirga sp. RKSG066]|uniref:GyrI-like domain-containing protein n=1 Tax=Fulvivirga aurantia TaxID=2529383 RepID=UPI0012BCFF4B|nr:GyrI-like domain-containing protein [Fulvivirga aurantia]MTI22618.1 hypothetical protein [Fulvivirga aurantia]
MTNIAVSKEPYVIELVVYKVKSEFRNNFHDLLEQARQQIKSLTGMVEYNTFKSTSNELVFIDLVKWETLDQAVDASRKVEQMKQLAPFMAAFEEVKFMDHFEQYTTFNNSESLSVGELASNYYQAGSEPKIVELNQYNYLMISGVSSPQDERFLKSMEAIYAVAYALKSHYKAVSKDFVVAPMEAQWWAEGPGTFEDTPMENWHWNIMIPMPEFITEDIVDLCIANTLKNKVTPYLNEVSLKPLNEGKTIQLMHIGCYLEEAPSIKKIMDLAERKGLSVNGHHHEIYISDPMKTPVEKLKTILRYPVI